MAETTEEMIMDLEESSSLEDIKPDTVALIKQNPTSFFSNLTSYLKNHQGMVSKIKAAEICMKSKCSVIITSGLKKNPIKSLAKQTTKSTRFISK